MSWAIAHVITKLELGGAQLSTLFEVAHGAIGRDHRYLLFGPGGMLTDRARSLPNVTCIEIEALAREIDPASEAAAFAQLRTAFNEIRARTGKKLLVHTHSSKAGILGRFAARSAKVDRIVHSIHGFGHAHHGGTVQRAAFRGLEQAAGAVTHGFTADSLANIRQAKAEGILGRKPHAVVHCGIDPSVYADDADMRARVRSGLGMADDDFVFLGLSCLKPQKDPLSFIRVAKQLEARAPHAKLLLAGDGELRGPCETLIRTLHCNNVTLLGWRQDVPDLLRASDALLHTSLWEGLPQAFGQAMAAGRPIVATRVDGAPEAIDDGVTGVLCEPADVDGMSAAAAGMANDPSWAKSLGDEGRARCHTFSQTTQLDALESFYRSLGVK